MKRTYLSIVCCVLSLVAFSENLTADLPGDYVEAQILLTVAESKRLIAKAVAELPEVSKARNNGTIVITKGSTNAYVAEEILGKSIDKNGYVIGSFIPSEPTAWPGFKPDMGEIILENGKVQNDMSLTDAAGRLEPGDVIIKGGNALDYENKLVGIVVGSPSGGTVGKILPSAVGSKAHLIIPIGLEKLVAGDLVEISNEMRKPVPGKEKIPSMFLTSGTIITEIEAIELLAGVKAFHAASGGLAGAEGAVWLIVRGSNACVDKALDIVSDIHGEPPFPK